MKLKTCPKCGSTDISSNYVLKPRYKCNTCDYEGDIIVERDVEKQFKK